MVEANQFLVRQELLEAQKKLQQESDRWCAFLTRLRRWHLGSEPVVLKIHHQVVDFLPLGG